MLSDFHTLCADFEAGAVGEWCPLEIWILTLVSRRVKFGSTNTVRVVTYNDGSFPASWT